MLNFIRYLKYNIDFQKLIIGKEFFMATSKIKEIKQTLKKAIDYIVNPDKTDSGLLVYSHGCSVETADIEMALTAKQGTGRGERIAYHLMQSFAPDDGISPEMALELGKEFAQKVTGGKYEFVIATHIDKNHIHNHIIFNAVDYVNHRKYHSDAKDKYRIRDINDEICKANNLSVLPKYNAKRKSKYENRHKKAKDTWQNKLRQAVDHVIQQSETFEDFLFALEMEGYEIKRGKHISFRAPGQERFTRAKSIGDEYTEDAICSRIANKSVESINNKTVESDTMDRSQEAAGWKNTVKTGSAENAKDRKNVLKQKRAFYSKRINLIVDISKNIKAQQSKGYEQALVRSNINTLVKTMNFLIEHKITTPEDFQIYADGKNAEYSLYRKDIRIIENELLDLSEKIKFTQNYKKNAFVFYESKRVKNQSEYIREHEDQIVLFKASQIYFERKQINPKELNLSELFEQYKVLKAQKEELVRRCNPLKSEIEELDRIAQNIEAALGIDFNENDKSLDETKERNDHDKQK